MVGGQTDLGMTLLAFTWLATLMLAAGGNNTSQGQVWVSAEERLIRKLLRDYEPTARPRRLATEAVWVNVSITFFQVDSLFSQEQHLKAMWCLKMVWFDDFLQWNPAQNEGLTSLVLGTANIWVPGLALKNSVDGYMYKTLLQFVRARVFWTGRVEWEPGQTFTTSCPLRMSMYPFDTQLCHVDITTWVYTRRQVELWALPHSEEVGRGQGLVDGEWLVQGIRVWNEWFGTPTEVATNMTYPHVFAQATLRRRSLFYVINILLPCFIQNGLLLLVYYLPPGGQRLGLAVGLLIAFSFLQVTVADTIPHTSLAVPLLVIYVSYLMVLTSLSIAVTTLVLHLHHKDPDETPPYWIRHVIYDVIGCCVCLDDGTRECKSPSGRSAKYEVNQNESKIFSTMTSAFPSSGMGENSDILNPAFEPENSIPRESSLLQRTIDNRDIYRNGICSSSTEEVQSTLREYSPTQHYLGCTNNLKGIKTDTVQQGRLANSVFSYEQNSDSVSNTTDNNPHNGANHTTSLRERRGRPTAKVKKHNVMGKKNYPNNDEYLNTIDTLPGRTGGHTQESTGHLDSACEYLLHQGRQVMDKHITGSREGGSEWGRLAKVVDKLLFRVFLTLTLVPSLVLIVGTYSMYG